MRDKKVVVEIYRVKKEGGGARKKNEQREEGQMEDWTGIERQPDNKIKMKKSLEKQEKKADGGNEG